MEGERRLGETCHPDNPFQVSDYVKVEGAHHSDQHASEPFHEDLINRGYKPETTYADSAYVSGKNIVASRDQGVALKGPMSGVAPRRLTLGHFEFNSERTQMIRCPAGEAPVRHAPSKTEGAMNAFFAVERCATCPLRAHCPVRHDQCSYISFRPTDVATGQRRCEQETDEFKCEYKIRSGIEATNSQLKNKRGLGRLRVRGSPAVTLTAIFKVVAENVWRMVKHALSIMKTPANAPAKA